MVNTFNEKANLVDLSDTAAPAELVVTTFSERERMVRSMKRLGLFWGIALGCVLIPILHFILVPSFVLVGIVIAIRTHAQVQRIVTLTSACPSCHKPLTFSNMPYRNGYKEQCPHCRHDLKLSLK